MQMAWGRRPYRGQRKYPGKSRSGYRRGKKVGTGWQPYANMAKQALKTASFVASLVNTEKKVIDTTISPVSVYNAGYGITPITLVGQGDDYNQRNGRSCKISDLDIRGTVKVNTGNAPAVFRWLLISDNDCQGANPTMTDVLTGTVTNDEVVYAFRNIASANPQRYTILKDKRITINPNGTTIHNIVYHKELQHHVKYLGSSSSITSAGAGSLFIVYIATGASAANGVLFEAKARARFIDN